MLTLSERDGFELFIEDSSGCCFASQSAIVRMTGKPRSTIVDFLNKVTEGINDPSQVRTEEVPTNGGTQIATLYGETIICKVFAKYRIDLLVQCAKAGLRFYLYGLAGHKVSVNSNRDKAIEELKARFTAIELELRSTRQSLELLGSNPGANLLGVEEKIRDRFRGQTVQWLKVRHLGRPYLKRMFKKSEIVRMVKGIGEWIDDSCIRFYP